MEKYSLYAINAGTDGYTKVMPLSESIVKKLAAKDKPKKLPAHHDMFVQPPRLVKKNNKSGKK